MELKLFLPNSSSDVASWAQAIGTIVAIVAAWKISRQDSLAIIERDYDATLKEEFFATANALRFAQTLMSAMFELSDALRRNDKIDTGLAFRRVAECLDWARQIPVALIASTVAEDFVKAREIAAKVLWCESNVSGKRRLDEVEDQTGFSMVCAGEMEKHYMAAYPKAPLYLHKRYGFEIPRPTLRRRAYRLLRRVVPAALRDRYSAWRAKARTTPVSPPKTPEA